MSTFIQKAEKFELEKYKKPRDVKSLLKAHVPFSGSPQKHPHDAEKLILVADPYSTYTYYYRIQQRRCRLRGKVVQSGGCPRQHHWHGENMGQKNECRSSVHTFSCS